MKLKPLIPFFFIVAIYSCKKDPPSFSIVGKWYIDSIQSIGSLWGNPFYTTIYKNSGENNYYDFNSNGKVDLYWNSLHDSLRYILTIPSSGNSYINYEANLSYADTILNLTESKLILRNPQGGGGLIYFTKY